MYLYNLYYYNSFSYFNNIDYILIRFGVFFKKQIIIPIDKIQSVTITNNYFQRRLGLSNLIIDTAASDNMSDASIPDMDSEDCNRLYKEINNILREKLKKKICIRGISDT
jgi:membrane protein YdbS with pleckstrin-like domain